VGSTWNRKGDRVAFVALEATRDPRPWLWAAGPGNASVRRLIRRAGPLPPPPEDQIAGEEREYRHRELGDLTVAAARVRPGRLRILPALISVRRARGDGEHLAPSLGVLLAGLDRLEKEGTLMPWSVELPLRQLQGLGLPDDMRVGYVGDLRPAAAGRRVFSRFGKTASLGSVVHIGERPLVTTAGHLDIRVGDGVLLGGGRFSRARDPIGPVAATTHAGAPDQNSHYADGIDICAVEAPDWSLPCASVEVRDAAELQYQQSLSWTGGLSGERAGWVSREMKGLEVGKLRFRNVLVVVGRRWGAGRDGDSGSAVYDTADALVGHIVATSGYRYGGRAQAVVVQDARTAFEYVVDRLGAVESVLRSSG
jgi:hypothetical protein